MKKWIAILLLALTLLLAGCGRSGHYITQCARCGKDVQVATKPSSDSVIYCLDCWDIVKAEQNAGGTP